MFVNGIFERVEEVVAAAMHGVHLHVGTSDENLHGADAESTEKSQEAGSGDVSPRGSSMETSDGDHGTNGVSSDGYGTNGDAKLGSDRDAGASSDCESDDSSTEDNGVASDGHANETNAPPVSDAQEATRVAGVSFSTIWYGITVCAGAVWSFFHDPFGMFIEGVNWILDCMGKYFGITSRIFGSILLLMCVNFLLMGVIRFMDLIGALWSLLGLFSFLPMFVLMRRVWGFLVRSLIAMATSLQKAELRKRKEEGIKGDIEQIKSELRTLKKNVGNANVTSMLKEFEDVNAVELLKGVYNRTLGRKGPHHKKLLARGHINGHEFPEMLIDTASDVNMLSEATALKCGFPFHETSARSIRGFTSRIYEKVLGELDVSLTFGPRGKCQSARFYVVKDCPSPLIGLPTLRDFGIIIDTTENKMRESDTGLVIMCAVADIEMGRKKKKKNAKVSTDVDVTGGETLSGSGSKN